MRRLRFHLGLLAVAATLGGLSVLGADAPRHRIRWVRELDGDPILMPVYAMQRSAPLVTGDRVVAATRDGTIYSLRKSDGATQWSRSFDGGIEAGLARDEKFLYAGLTTGALAALNPQTGVPVWFAPTSHEIMGKPVPDGSRVFVSAGNNQVFAFDRQTGAWGWQYSGGEDADLTIRGVAGISVVDSAIFTAFSNGTVVRLDKTKGIAVWTQKFSSGTKYEDVDSTPVVFGGRVCVVVYGSRLICLKADDGSTLWTAAIQAHQAPETDGESLYLGGLDGAVKALDGTTGAIRWTTQVASVAANSPRLVGNSLFVSDEDGRLTELDTKSGEVRWHYDGAISGTFAPVVWDGESVYLISNMGNLFRISVGNPIP